MRHDRCDLWDIYESPLGRLTLTTGPRGLTGLHFPGRPEPLEERRRRPAALAAAVRQLDEYFAGERRSFDLELDLAGTPVQRRIWQRLLVIPYGSTITYGELAAAIGRPDIVRGAAAAVGRTPVPIVVPCHRVLAASGALSGYGGGLHPKRALLRLERSGALGTEAPAWDARQLAMF